MAQTTLMPKRRQFLEGIKTSQKSFATTQTTITNLSKLLKERKEKREKISSAILTEKRKREYLTLRQESEDELEAKRVVSNPNILSSLGSVAANTGGSFIDRIVNTLGYLAAGWIIRNLPTWEGMAKEFIARLQEAGRIIGSFVTDAIRVFQSSYNLITGAIQNLKNFDLTDSSGNIRTSFDELVDSINDMGSELEAGIKLITTPLTQTAEDGSQVGTYSGEEVPGLGSTSTDMGAYADSGGSGGSSSTASGNNYERAFLDMIAIAEGTSKSYGTMFGGNVNKDLESGKLTVREAIQLGDSNAKKYGSGATGRYQFMPPTLEGLVRKGVLKMDEKFTPQKQDQAAIALAKGRGVDPSKQLTKNDMYRLGGEWASIEGGPNMKPGGSYSFGGRSQVKYTAEQALKVYQSKLSSNPQSQPQPQRAISTPSTTLTGGEYFKPLPQGSFKGGPSQVFGASRDDGKRKHLGLDITETNWKPGSDPRIPVVAIRGGVVVSVVPGSQYLSDAVIEQDDGYRVRYLHMTPSVKTGQKVSAGQQIGRLVNLGNQTHLHLELYKGSQILDPTSYIKAIESGARPKTQITPAPQPAQTTPPKAQISSTPAQQSKQQMAQALVPDNKPQDIVAIIPEHQMSPQMPQPSGAPSGGASPSVSMGMLLNNFMKQKLLLDLSYV